MNKPFKYSLIALGIILLLSAVYLLNKHFTKKPELGKSCENIFSMECQDYLVKITNEKKYEETVKIQSVRIKETEKLLDNNKNKIIEKSLFSMNAKEADEYYNKRLSELEKKNGGKQKYDEIGAPVFEEFEKDYAHLLYNNKLIGDIILDSMVVATIQRKELKDYYASIYTLKNAKKVLDENGYAADLDTYSKMIERNIKKAEKLLK